MLQVIACQCITLLVSNGSMFVLFFRFNYPYMPYPLGIGVTVAGLWLFWLDPLVVLLLNIFKSYDFHIYWFWTYMMKVSMYSRGHVVSTKCYLYVYDYDHDYDCWADTFGDGVLDPDGIISPVVGISALTFFIRYIHYWIIAWHLSSAI